MKTMKGKRNKKPLFKNGDRVVWLEAGQPIGRPTAGAIRDTHRVGGQTLYAIEKDGEPLPVEIAEIELSLEPAPRHDTRYTVKAEDLTLPEAEMEKDSLDRWFRALRENQEGFSSKDCIRYRDVCGRLRKLTNRFVDERMG